MLALEDGRFQTTGPYASFVRGNPLSTGRLRVLSDLQTYSTDDSITVFAADQAFNTLLEIPYATRGASESTHGGGRCHQRAGFHRQYKQQPGAEMRDLLPQSGFAATEEWSVTYTGTDWTIEGSRSGLLETNAKTGSAYVSDDSALSFQIVGAPNVGDRFTFTTDSGIIEHDVGGRPIRLAMSPDASTLAVVVEDVATGARALRLMTPSTGEFITATLAEDSHPPDHGMVRIQAIRYTSRTSSGHPCGHLRPTPTFQQN